MTHGAFPGKVHRRSDSFATVVPLALVFNSTLGLGGSRGPLESPGIGCIAQAVPLPVDGAMASCRVCKGP